MKRVLVGSGGGVMGASSVQVLKYLEQKSDKPLYQTYDIIGGSSVAAIHAGIVATGLLTMNKYEEMFLGCLPDVFEKRTWIPWPPLYEKDNFRRVWKKYLPEDLRLGDVKTKLCIMCVEGCSKTNFLIRSWEPDFKDYKLLDVITWSFSAPLYFGQTNCPEIQKVFSDGGCGTQNFPIDFIKTETEKLGWYNNEYILFDALGTGFVDPVQPYNEVSKFRTIEQLKNFFLRSSDGGLARTQSRVDETGKMGSIARANKNVGFRYFDFATTNEYNSMDKLKYLDYYIAQGKAMAEKPLVSINVRE